ncbi:hypothetical protein Micbo1qcDRAFT_173947 [Microdochium bolleyi]|uniref:Uncharacterized protein n=1 Tax=Microdochium bolleyi TaxID=196109 RepID=A0A136J6I6_9PEZI|nr:hypothetical protein Micbo1qcDRAFT_173947 [Microdochium bolleyi]
MPRLRGVELSLVAGFGSRAVPEYPHPDASSVCVRPLANREHPLNSDGQTQLTAVSPAPQDSSLSFKKSHARVSVYVSSTPENEFRLRYAIDNSPAPAKIIFFKLLMNGRHIVSWGIDTTQRNEGTVARALYHPSTKQDNKRASREQPTTRIESRYFHFAPEREPKSAAEDGGLIEVRVFRCKGRQRVAAALDHYRDQEKYGIASPSGGILDRPEDTCFYDYHLLDAKDSPYATFLFHYRSMKYLEQLNLIPALQLRSQSSRSDEANYRNHKSTPSINSGRTAQPIKCEVERAVPVFVSEVQLPIPDAISNTIYGKCRVHK